MAAKPGQALDARTLDYLVAAKTLKYIFCDEGSILRDYEGKYELYIFSQGHPSYFTNMTRYFVEQLNPYKLGKIVYRIESGRTMEDLDEMASVDVFLGGVSSFSALAGVLNDHGVVIMQSHKYVSARSERMRIHLRAAAFPFRIYNFNEQFCLLRKKGIVLRNNSSACELG